jgi:hypothetical protein
VGQQVFTDLWGLRARRWGVMVLARMPFYHWVSLQLPGRCITAWQFESSEGEVLYCDGAVVTEEGDVTPITSLQHDWTSTPGRRHPDETRFALLTAAGEVLRVKCRRIGSHFLSPTTGHWSDSDAAALAAADATAFSVEAYCEVTVGGEHGFGIVDIVTRPGYRRYGLAALMD